MKLKFAIVASFLGMLLFVLDSCKKDQVVIPVVATNSTVKVFPMYGNQALYLDSVYQTLQGFDIAFSEIKFFATAWKSGSEVFTEAALFDYRETGNSFASTSASPEKFPSLQGFLGVPASINHADPSAFPNESALNIMNAGDMHWGWNPGYIFIKVEAKVDTIPDGIPLFDHHVSLHIGTDVFLQTLDFPVVIWKDLGGNQFLASLKLDMQRFLTNGTEIIDLKTEHISHSGAGQGALSQKAIQNFKAALSFMN